MVGIIANMPARLLTRFKDTAPEGSFIEALVWHLDGPVPPSEHDFKYRLVYIRSGVRVVGFDNERDKDDKGGDHCHLNGVEVQYIFSTIEQLFIDFEAEVAKRTNP